METPVYRTVPQRTHAAAFAQPSVTVDIPRNESQFGFASAAILLVIAVFFVAEHRWEISLRSDFLAEAESMEVGTIQDDFGQRLGFTTLGAAGALCLATPSLRRLRMRGLLAWLSLAAALWCVASCGWTVEPIVTTRRVFAFLCIAAAAMAAAQLATFREVTWLAFIVSFVYLSLGVCVEIVLGTFHPIPGAYRFAGTLHPNHQSLNCAVLCMSALYLYRTTIPRNRWLIVAAAVGFYFLLLTNSHVALASLIVAEIMFGLLAASLRVKFGWLLCATWVGALIYATSSQEIGQWIQSVAQAGWHGNDLLTLNGRIPLWENLCKFVAERPLAGYGFDGFWTPEHIATLSTSQGLPVAVARSIFLDLTLGVGFVGAAICVLAALFAVGRAARAHRRVPRSGDGFAGVVILYCLLHGLLDSAMILPGFVPFIAMCGLAHLSFGTEPDDDRIDWVTRSIARPARRT